MRDRKLYPKEEVLDGVSANTVSNAIFVSDFRNTVIAVGTSGSADATFKLKGATGDVAPDFTSPKSESNQWDYIELVKLRDGNSLDGNVGYSFAGVDDVYLFEANINGLDFVSAVVENYVAGSLSCSIALYDND